MRTFETKTIPARKERVLAAVHCDLCGREAKGDRNWDDRSSYVVDEAKVEVQVRHEEGTSFPEGGLIKSKSYDICPTCFEEVLVPVLESKGAKPIIATTDF
jgi:hypothetical protein